MQWHIITAAKHRSSSYLIMHGHETDIHRWSVAFMNIDNHTLAADEELLWINVIEHTRGNCTDTARCCIAKADHRPNQVVPSVFLVCYRFTKTNGDISRG